MRPKRPGYYWTWQEYMPTGGTQTVWTEPALLYWDGKGWPFKPGIQHWGAHPTLWIGPLTAPSVRPTQSVELEES